MQSRQLLQTIEQIRTSPNLSEEFKRLLETCPVNPKPHKQYNELRIICPRCDDVGRLNSFHPFNEDPGTVYYYIAHEKRDRNRSTWGKSRRKKYSRCYLNILFNNPQYLQKITDQIFPYDP